MQSSRRRWRELLLLATGRSCEATVKMWFGFERRTGRSCDDAVWGMLNHTVVVTCMLSQQLQFLRWALLAWAVSSISVTAVLGQNIQYVRVAVAYSGVAPVVTEIMRM